MKFEGTRRSHDRTGCDSGSQSHGVDWYWEHPELGRIKAPFAVYTTRDDCTALCHYTDAVNISRANIDVGYPKLDILLPSGTAPWTIRHRVYNILVLW